MKLMYLQLILLSILSIGLFNIVKGQEKVKVWEEPLILSTYVTKGPDKNPMFFHNQSYQGASRYIYPYALEDNITNEKIEKTYQALYLENEYIKLCVLPEIGGRLFYATDKTNGYELFYRQHVIKPANIGMLGAWISGGIEFCVFHHHRASTNLPVDYKLEENADGSSTIWIGETEPRHRMKWTLGISLFPGKSYIEVDGRLINPTENINSILYWANVATHVNEDYQVIFPPSTDFAVFHAKNSFAHWPITSEVYNGREYYKNKIDASWWKNHPNPISMFAHNIQEGFLAGYDHGKKAGTMHVANHHIVKGAKLWEWGPGPYGAMWDSKVLTDSDGPYAELMTGAYSDNQPDYSWIKPYEYKTLKQYWYPIWQTEGAVAANLKAMVNFKKVGEDQFFIAANTTESIEDATISITKSDQIVYEKKLQIAPDHPFTDEVEIPNTSEEELTLAILDNHGETLISYSPKLKRSDPPLPEPVVTPLPPEEITSLEELYITGLRISQFHNARIDATSYFQEALKRDPLDIRSNTMMGIILKENFKMDEAAQHFRKALSRLTANYTHPRNCEPFYHLGVILQKQGKYEDAYDTLYRAAWDQDFASAAYYHLAQISIIKQNLSEALIEANRALDYNSSNLNAMNLKTTILRELGYQEDAKKLLVEVLKRDGLNFRGLYEGVLLGVINSEKWKKMMRNSPESYLELALGYLNSGFQKEAKSILLAAVHSEDKALKDYPTLSYYLGYIFAEQNQRDSAQLYFNYGKRLSTDYCFPFRFETIAVYHTALQYNPSDTRALYYLGNLLFDRQPENAISSWEKAVEIEASLAIAHRNLGWGYNQTYNDLEKAIASYETAIKYDRTEPKYYYELDKLYEKNGTKINKRYKLLTENHEYVSQRPDAFLQEVQVLLLVGESKLAIEYLLNNFFPRQEGVDNLHEIYADACLVQGLEKLYSSKPKEALEFFQLADKYPENHQIARDQTYEKNAQIFYYQAMAHEELGQKDQASTLFAKVIKSSVDSPEYKFYQALAYQKVGSNKQAEVLADGLIDDGNELLSSSKEVDFFSKFGEGQSEKSRMAKGNYLLGLANLIKGNKAGAIAYFKKANELNPHDLWVKINLDNI